MKFTKMHGTGNDYVYLNCLDGMPENPGELSRRVSDRHFGIGSDGLILICPSEKADFRMDMYNADGSRGMMCGNGIRCVGKYVYDHGLTDQTTIRIETLSGIKTLHLSLRDAKEDTAVLRGISDDLVNQKGKVVSGVTVNMGAPIFAPEKVPVAPKPGFRTTRLGDILSRWKKDLVTTGAPWLDEEAVVGMPIPINDAIYYGTCVSVGNPHCIIFVDDTDAFPVAEAGPVFESYKAFPDRVNTEFVQVIDRTHVKMRVWERGSGETLACGTGACATAVACCLNGKTDFDTDITVSLLGGDLKIRWDLEQQEVLMTGPAVTSFEGEF